MSFVRSAWLAFAYYLSWLLFACGGLALALGCAPFLLLPRRERFGPAARAATRRLLGLWVRWLGASRVITSSFHGFTGPLPGGVVYVANHPSIVDATFLLSRLPDTVCIFKPALLRHPCIAPAALLCGYVPGASGVDGIRAAAAAVAAGRSLLIFPEGTRTPVGDHLGPLRPGFALIAHRARAPVRLVRVRASPALGRKNIPWWRLPPLPGHVEFTLDEFIPSDPLPPAAELTSLVADRLLSGLVADSARA